MKFLTYFLAFFLFISIPKRQVNADPHFMRYAEDYFQYIPLIYGYGLTIYKKDLRGAAELTGATLLTMGTTYGLKYTVQETRPSGDSHDSFPSAHTSFAFAPSTFIAKRYGILYALPAYALAVTTASLRVVHHQHFWWDVLAGAAIGSLFGYLVSTEYVDKTKAFSINVSPRIGGGALSLGFYWK
jgi:membrane-associated phospholipid phosphatase